MLAIVWEIPDRLAASITTSCSHSQLRFKSHPCDCISLSSDCNPATTPEFFSTFLAAYNATTNLDQPPTTSLAPGSFTKASITPIPASRTATTLLPQVRYSAASANLSTTLLLLPISTPSIGIEPLPLQLPPQVACNQLACLPCHWCPNAPPIAQQPHRSHHPLLTLPECHSPCFLSTLSVPPKPLLQLLVQPATPPMLALPPSQLKPRSATPPPTSPLTQNQYHHHHHHPHPYPYTNHQVLSPPTSINHPVNAGQAIAIHLAIASKHQMLANFPSHATAAKRAGHSKVADCITHHLTNVVPPAPALKKVPPAPTQQHRTPA